MLNEDKLEDTFGVFSLECETNENDELRLIPNMTEAFSPMHLDFCFILILEKIDEDNDNEVFLEELVEKQSFKFIVSPDNASDQFRLSHYEHRGFTYKNLYNVIQEVRKVMLK